MKYILLTIYAVMVIIEVSANNLIEQHQLDDFEDEGRIIGGEEVIPNSLPYQALLHVHTSSNTLVAGGSLISPNYILSAASVLFRANSVQIFLGKHNRSIVEQYELEVSSTNIIIHDKWNQDNLNNDIALVMFPEPIEFTTQIAPIALPRLSDIGEDYLYDLARISGWGSIQANDDLSDVLRQTNVNITTNLDCELAFPGAVHQSLCSSGDEVIAKGLGIGDSGGPLALDGVQIGVASMAHWYLEGQPSVYTRVWSYLIWIADNTDVVLKP